jgi:predicted DNA-binding transcriptional regulator AlpA
MSASAVDLRARDVAAHRNPNRVATPRLKEGGSVIAQALPSACEQLLRKPAVAGLLGIGVRTLERMMATKEFPAPDIKRGSRLLLWRPSTVQSWIENQSQRLQRGGVR